MTLGRRVTIGKDNESNRNNEVEEISDFLTPSGKNDNSGLGTDGFDR